MKRRIYLCVAVVLALVAGALTLRAQHTVPVLVATRNVSAGSQLTNADVEVLAMHQDSVPAGALASADGASGKYVAWPLTSGEPVLSSALSSQQSGADVVAGYTVPTGYRAIAIPVTPAAAVGGMLTPGDHVDVYATPTGQGNNASNAGATSAESSLPMSSTTTVVLASDILVLQLRSDQGQPLSSSNGSSDGSVHGLNFNSTKLGSIVVAVPDADVANFAAAASSDAMYVALSVK